MPIEASSYAHQIDWLFYFKQPAQMPALIQGNSWMFPSILALAAVGVIAQLELGSRGEPKKSKPKDD